MVKLYARFCLPSFFNITPINSCSEGSRTEKIPVHFFSDDVCCTHELGVKFEGIAIGFNLLCFFEIHNTLDVDWFDVKLISIKLMSILLDLSE